MHLKRYGAFVLLSMGIFFSPSAQGVLPQFADVVEKVLPAVVDITTQLTPEFSMDTPALSLEDWLREHLEKQMQDQPKRAAAGSGFVIESTDDHALVVTNFHVIDNADEIYVKFSQDSDRSSVNESKGIRAEVVGKDRRTDIALLKIKTKQKHHILTLADSSKVRTGEWVLSIGNPFGFGSTVTSGIVSKKSRDISDQTRTTGIGDYIREYIQTDASVNSGNSGGPLINTEGEVIGVNAIIFSPHGTNLGIAFSIPSNTVRETVDQIKKYGRTRRGWLGILVQKVSADLAESIGLTKPAGVAVSSVFPQSPADKAGFQEGDILLSIEGVEVKDVRDVPHLVGELPVGKVITARIWRQKEMNLKVSVGDYEDAEEKGLIQNLYNKDIPTGRPRQDAGRSLLGMTLQDMTPRLRQYYGLKDDVKGVLVTRVQRNSIAAEQGIQQGDVISRVDREKVQSVADFVSRIEIARKNGKKSMVLIVYMGNEASKIVVLNLDGKPKNISDEED